MFEENKLLMSSDSAFLVEILKRAYSERIASCGLKSDRFQLVECEHIEFIIGNSGCIIKLIHKEAH